MDRLTLFRYFPTGSVFHRVDPRIKLLSMFLFSLLIFRLPLPSVLILISFSVAALAISKVPLRNLFLLLWPFYILFGIILLVKLYPDGGGISHTQHLLEGTVLISRMLLLILFGHLYTSTTTFEETRKSILWFLKPLPEQVGFIVSTMLSITLAFIPLLFSQSREIRQAQQARCIDASKNPLRKIKYFAVQVIITSLEKGDQIGEAMESRCYGPERTVTFPSLQFDSWLFLLIIVTLALSVLFLPKVLPVPFQSIIVNSG